MSGIEWTDDDIRNVIEDRVFLSDAESHIICMWGEELLAARKELRLWRALASKCITQDKLLPWPELNQDQAYVAFLLDRLWIFQKEVKDEEQTSSDG